MANLHLADRLIHKCGGLTDREMKEQVLRFNGHRTRERDYHKSSNCSFKL